MSRIAAGTRRMATLILLRMGGADPGAISCIYSCTSQLPSKGRKPLTVLGQASTKGALLLASTFHVRP